MHERQKRRGLRRPITYPASIDPGNGAAAIACRLRDVSEGGARLDVADGGSVPDRFTLALSADGAARRHCRVAWRAENQVGVEFLKPPKRAGDTDVTYPYYIDTVSRR